MGTPNFEVEFEMQMDHTDDLIRHPNFELSEWWDNVFGPYGDGFFVFSNDHLDELIAMIRQGRTPRPDCKVRQGKPLLKKRLLHPKTNRNRSRKEQAEVDSKLRARRRSIRQDDLVQLEDYDPTEYRSVGEFVAATRDHNGIDPGDPIDTKVPLWYELGYECPEDLEEAYAAAEAFHNDPRTMAVEI